jgi:hypothetical protein
MVYAVEKRGLHFLRPQFLAASFFGRDLALDAKGKGVRFGVCAAFDRHGPVEGHFVFEDHDFRNLIQQELPPGRNLSSR